MDRHTLVADGTRTPIHTRARDTCFACDDYRIFTGQAASAVDANYETRIDEGSSEASVVLNGSTKSTHPGRLLTKRSNF